MAYHVKITARAERDLNFLYAEINAEHSEAALKWYQRLRRAILSLDRLPNRCPKTPESVNLRQLLFGRMPHIYRVIYRVNEALKEVEVLHIRHGARAKFKPTVGGESS